MGKAKTEHELLAMRWADGDVDEGDALHKHFEELQDSGHLEDFVDIAKEGRRLWRRMFKEKIEPYSPADSVISAVAAAGYALAIEHVAQRLGVADSVVRDAIETGGGADAEKFLQQCRDMRSPERLEKIAAAFRACAAKEQE